MSDRIYIGNDHLLLVTLTGDDGAPITSGTVTATMTDTAGEAVAGETWPVALTHTTGGVWQVVLQSDIQIRDGRMYRVNVTAVNGTINGAWRETFRAAYRGFDD